MTKPFLLDASGLLSRVAVKDGAHDATCSCYLAIPAVILQQNNGLDEGATHTVRPPSNRGTQRKPNERQRKPGKSTLAVADPENLCFDVFWVFGGKGDGCPASGHKSWQKVGAKHETTLADAGLGTL